MDQDIDFIVDQIVFLSIYNDKQIVIRPNVADERRKINNSIINMLQSDDNFMIYSALREIRDSFSNKEIEIKDAIAEVRMALLLRDEKYIKRGRDRYYEIRKEIKDAVIEFTKGMPVELPVKLYQDLGIDVFSYTVQNKWKDLQVADSEKDKKISAILNRYIPAKDVEVRKYIENELNETPDEFIKELSRLDDKDLNERIDEWSDYNNELANVFDDVAQENSFDKEAFDMYRLAFIKKENAKLTKIRDKYTDVLYDLFITYGNPLNYTGKKKEMSKKYIRNKLLPFILYFCAESGKQCQEDYVYNGYIVKHLKSLGKEYSSLPKHIKDLTKDVVANIPTLGKTSNEEKIENILSRYNLAKDDKIREYAYKELKRMPVKAINELTTLNNAALSSTLTNKINYENELSLIYREAESNNFKDEEFAEYLVEYKMKAKKNEKLETMRQKYATALYETFKKYGNPKGSGFPSNITVKYIRDYVLPYTMYYFVKRDKYPLESYVYGAYLIKALADTHTSLDDDSDLIKELYRRFGKSRESIPIKEYKGEVTPIVAKPKKDILSKSNTVSQKVAKDSEQTIVYKIDKPNVGQKVVLTIDEKKRTTKVKEIIDRTEDPLDAIDLIVLENDKVAAIVAGRWELLYEERDNYLSFLK